MNKRNLKTMKIIFFIFIGVIIISSCSKNNQINTSAVITETISTNISTIKPTLITIPTYTNTKNPTKFLTYTITFSPTLTIPPINVWYFTAFKDNNITCLALDPINPEILYANDHGVSKSTDGGDNWVNLNLVLQNSYVDPIIIDPITPSILFAGTLHDGIFKSSNGGKDWTNIGLIDTTIRAMAIDPKNPNILYVGTFGQGIYKSVNGGKDWTEIGRKNSGFYTGVYTVVVDPSNPNIIYVGTGGKGVYKSIDGGENWQTIGINNTYVWLLFVDPVITTTLYADLPFGGGLYKSTDGGNNWNWLHSSIGTMIIDPANSNNIYIGTEKEGVFMSTDGGRKWVSVNTGLTSKWIFDFAIVRTSSTVLYAGTANGIYKIYL